MQINIKIPVFFILALNCSVALSQTVFWTEDFGTGCNQGQVANGVVTANGTWVVNATGTNDAQANRWYISAKEDGTGAGNCSDKTCTNNNQSLHVSSNDGVVVNDKQCNYDAGGLCSLFSICVTTNTRAESPTINCTGYSTITLTFNYIENGSGSTDNGTCWYYDGTSWSQLADMPKTAGCTVGQWTSYSVSLPASADNNANVKIGFNWTNNDDGIGTDPSLATDDITLSYLTLLPVELLSFSADRKDEQVVLSWSTASEINNNYFTVERSADGINFIDIQRINGAGNSNSLLSYSCIDNNPLNGINYYRLQQTDFDGKFTYSKIIVTDFTTADDFGIKSVYYSSLTQSVNLTVVASSSSRLSVDMSDISGRTLSQQKFTLSSAENILTVPLSDVAPGIYMLKLDNGFNSHVCKIIF